MHILFFKERLTLFSRDSFYIKKMFFLRKKESTKINCDSHTCKYFFLQKKNVFFDNFLSFFF